MTLQIGETVGSYRVIAQLGQGGMATVYKAYHASLDRYVAIKVLHPAFKEDSTFLGRFQREARVLAKLDHPNIVPIYDFAEHNGQPYLVMKYVEGDTLKARLARGPLSLGDTLKVVDAVGSALAYAHRQGILHRDIKPSNIIITADGTYYLSDFGLARIASAGESTFSQDTLLGTPNYISPEQARGLADLDGRTDIYSFGVVLYELICGRVPFSADTPFSVIHDHIYTPLPPPTAVNPNVSEPLEMFLLKALAKDRADRFADAGAMMAAFHNAVADQLPGAATHHAAPASTPPSAAATAPAPARLQTPRPAAPADSDSTVPMPPAAATVRAGPAIAAAAPTVVAKGTAAPVAEPAPRQTSWLLIAGGIVIVLLLGLGGLFIVGRAVRNNQRATQTAAVVATEPPPATAAASDPFASLEAAVQSDPDNASAHLRLAEAYYSAGRKHDAVIEWNRAAEIEEYDPRFYSTDILSLLGADPVTALEVLLPGLQQNDSRAMRELAVPALEAAAAFPAAEPILRQYAAEFPDWAAAQAALARYYIVQGQPEKAKPIIEEMRAKFGSEPAVKIAYADYLAAIGDLDGAITVYQSILDDRATPVILRGFVQRRINELNELKGTPAP